ncbi:MAG: hypothetical protein EOM12_19040 [Verrucomicrobiae bacterium]|nr:hypothetical protein [Verrucomicrobiae bacterium]
MTAMKFYAGAMKKALSYVAEHSKSSHIHSVQWTEASFTSTSGDRLQVEIETTDDEGQADYRWQFQVYKFDNQKAFVIDESRIDVAKLY